MNINKINLKWNGNLEKRNTTKYIVLHHRAGNGDIESIHSQHQRQGYSGVGYHFYIRKDGSVFEGRPRDVVGAHCLGYNDLSLGICFEGNFESEKMSPTQIKAGQQLIAYLKEIYPKAEVKKHNDFSSTACPGIYFKFDEITKRTEKKKLTSSNDIVWELSQRVEIKEVDKAVKSLERAKNEDSSLYWILYKIVNV